MSKIMMRLPKALQEGDEITISGHLVDGANELSIDFTADADVEDPEDIIYHFKVHQSKISQNTKVSGEWLPGETEANTFILEEKNLTLTFKFISDEVFVYSGDEGRNFECQFRLNEPMAHIGAVHVSGDVKRISQVTFRYA
ncbi:unnamed protein product [Hermetia illucens]|uniref:Galectin n=1 Tax=Hermetia illucens TaxID=343691 RepID=A0A7R8Z0D9_HERIL|nr:uncharacterized protein LOC119660403 [Hermetia illucens]CAD7092529.1 unnamed protein product [Hermetia illucens]